MDNFYEKDLEKAEKRLARKFKKGNVFAPAKLKPIGQLEKICGKEEINKLMYKPEGALILVPEDDKRKAEEVKSPEQQVLDDFSDTIETIESPNDDISALLGIAPPEKNEASEVDSIESLIG
jgi:hypothetical protein